MGLPNGAYEILQKKPIIGIYFFSREVQFWMRVYWPSARHQQFRHWRRVCRRPIRA